MRDMLVRSIQQSVWRLIINQLMQGSCQKERSYHSQDRRRSISREQARKYKLEKVKMRFKNIASRIREIKNENTSDLTQLGTLMRGSEEIEKMANQSLEKASLFLSESKLQKKRVTSPNYHEAKHTNPQTQDFTHHLNEEHSQGSFAKIEAHGKRKPKNGKRSVAAVHVKTDETSESEAIKELPIEKISEIELQQEFSGIKEEQDVPQENALGEPIKQQETKLEIEEPRAQAEGMKTMRQSTSNRSLLKSGSRFASTQGSLRASLRRSLNPPQHTRKVESIYPFIAIIIFSIVLLLGLRT